MSAYQYIPTARLPIRFDKLRPGSFFRIVSEPSRKIKKSSDQRIYRKAYDGFYSTVVGSDQGVVLYPGDSVEPLKRVAVK